MSTVIVFQPCSKATVRLMSLTIKPGVSRVMSVIKKITRLSYHVRHGRPHDLITLYQWRRDILQLAGYFDREIVRLSKALKRGCQDKTMFEKEPGRVYRIKTDAPASADFYRLLSKYDILMSLTEAIVILGLSDMRQLRLTTERMYSKKLFRLMDAVAQYRFATQDTDDATLNPDERNTLAHALQSDVIPVLGKQVFDALITAHINQPNEEPL